MDENEPVKVINQTVPPSPWAKVTRSKEESLADIMSEELAKDLQLKEDSYYKTETSDVDFLTFGDVIEDETTFDCDSDEAIARALQLQFDKEHDEILKRTENKFNGDSKVSVSYTKYRRAPYSDDFESESEPEEDLDDRHRVWDSFEASEKSHGQIPRCGYRKLGANELSPDDEVQQQKPESSLGRSPGKSTMVTKHDVVTADRKNACRVMTAFPPEVCTGDGGGFDMRLSNKVFNSLRAHHQSESKRRLRVVDKSERATCEQCLDPPTRLLLLKLLDGGTLEAIHGILGTGKEAVVLHAMGGPGVSADQSAGWSAKDLVIPEECAIKIFKTTLNRFKSREKYIREDYRFKDRFSKQNPRKVIHLWAEKEMHNLIRMQKAGISCPDVVCLKKHILVMSFVGDGERHRAAPKLKDATLKPEQYVKAYNQIVEAMVKLYRDAELVHCDLSEYNVLWQSKQERCVIIDVAQAVEASSHPHALPFLLRDCENVSSFFRRKGVREAKSAKDLFTEVTGHSLNEDSGRTLAEQIQNYEKNEERLTHGLPEKSYSFDYCWEQSKKLVEACESEEGAEGGE